MKDLLKALQRRDLAKQLGITEGIAQTVHQVDYEGDLLRRRVLNIAFDQLIQDAPDVEVA